MAYLFTYFSNDKEGEKEQIWFSVSYDGLNWLDIGTREPVLFSCVGTTGVRDPFIIYDGERKKYVIIATDLCTTKGGNWDDYSSRGSRSLLVWESDDLINWSEARLVEVGIEGAGCVWAPEAVYCKEKESWFVFWASRVREKGENASKQRIYGAFTKDFISFTPAFKYIDKETDIIDTNIVFDEGFYYRFSKDETNKIIIMERCEELIPRGDKGYERIDCELLDSLYGLEGPEAYKLEKGKWCLIADRYSKGTGYFPLICESLEKADFKLVDEGSYNMGKRKKRHGGVISISEQQLRRLIAHYGTKE